MRGALLNIVLAAIVGCIAVLVLSLPAEIMWDRYATSRSLSAMIAGDCRGAAEWGARAGRIEYEVTRRCFRDRDW
jgi:hypothetical protein